MSAIERECREFAEQFPTPNVHRAIEHAEQGDITWEQVHGLFHRSLAAAVTEVARTCTTCGEPEGSQWARPDCTFA